MDAQLLQVLTHLDQTLTQISHDMGWFFTLNIGIALTGGLVMVALLWAMRRQMAREAGLHAKAFSDITAIAQSIASQTRELLRRTDP